MGNPNWRTPPEFFRKLNEEFHFTIDAAASVENALCGSFCTVDGLYELTDGVRAFRPSLDGLKLNLSVGDRVFCNPPYTRGELGQWVPRMASNARYGALVVMLLPASIDTRWFHENIWDRELHRARDRMEVRFLEGRLHFIDPTGQGKDDPPAGNMVVVMRPPL